jgi:sec-independent protein translocase protein TatB
MYPSIWEIGVVLLVAFLFLGPERLPDVARKLGRLFNMARRTANELRVGLEREVRQLEQPLRDVQAQIEQANNTIDRSSIPLPRDSKPVPEASPTAAPHDGGSDAQATTPEAPSGEPTAGRSADVAASTVAPAQTDAPKPTEANARPPEPSVPRNQPPVGPDDPEPAGATGQADGAPPETTEDP